MPEYILKMIDEAEPVAKRMTAKNDSAAILEAIRLEDHDSDLQLFCGTRLVADKRFSLWCLEPEVLSATRAATVRLAVDPFTVKVGWVNVCAGHRRPAASASIIGAR